MEDRSEVNRVQEMQQYLMSPDEAMSPPFSNNGSLTISTLGPATPQEPTSVVNKAIAWHKAVAERPLPALLMPVKSFKKPTHINIISGAVSKTATSPTLSVRSNSASDSSALAERHTYTGSDHRRTRKDYRLDMRNQVVAGLWKALQDLKPS